MSPLRWCLPLVQGRGAGLGNELVPWARAYLMSRVLGAHCLAPAFGMNQRGYRRHFGGSRSDWLWQRAMAATLPRVRFDEADYLAHGGGDVVQAFARFATARGLAQREPLLVLTDGLWGGIQHVARAREFVRGVLYRSRFAAANLAELSARLDPARLTVAMHVRLGDFAAAPADAAAYRGRFNCALPLAWFLDIGRQLRQALGDGVQFQVFSDGTPAQLAPLTALLQPLDTRCAQPADVSDLLALSQADLLVCSVSSYSVWAAALSSAPYLWFRPQLHEHAGGGLSIWGHEAGQARPGSPTLAALAARPATGGRAHAVGLADTLPAALWQNLQQRAAWQRREGDLVRYGAVHDPENKTP